MTDERLLQLMRTPADFFQRYPAHRTLADYFTYLDEENAACEELETARTPPRRLPFDSYGADGIGRVEDADTQAPLGESAHPFPALNTPVNLFKELALWDDSRRITTMLSSRWTSN
ncbi:hypothetical protein HDU88_007828 [Geranomyces variabilis]|nr:hypothetical protein HDU88_007828 [Geranomyces variabilis]